MKNIGYYSSGMYKGGTTKVYYNPENPNNFRSSSGNFASGMMIFMGIMVVSLVNIVRWQNPLLLQGFISIFKILVCLFYSLFILYYLDIFGRKRFLCIMSYSILFFDLLISLQENSLILILICSSAVLGI